jgi:hypothetical protein
MSHHTQTSPHFLLFPENHDAAAISSDSIGLRRHRNIATGIINDASVATSFETSISFLSFGRHHCPQYRHLRSVISDSIQRHNR